MMKALKMQQNQQESGDTPDDADASDAGDPFAVDDSTYGKVRPGNPARFHAQSTFYAMIRTRYMYRWRCICENGKLKARDLSPSQRRYYQRLKLT